MLPYWIPSLQRLQDKLQKCNSCCQGNARYHCPICPTTKFKPARLVRAKSHLHDSHWNFREKCVVGKKVTYAVPCRLSHGKLGVGSRGRHYHCPLCRVTITCRPGFKNHMVNACKVMRQMQESGVVDDQGEHYVDTTSDNDITQSFGMACDRTIRVNIDGTQFVVKVPAAVADKINSGDSDTIKMIYDEVKRTNSAPADGSDPIQSNIPGVSTQQNVISLPVITNGSTPLQSAVSQASPDNDTLDDGASPDNDMYEEAAMVDDSMADTLLSAEDDDSNLHTSMNVSDVLSQHDYSMIPPEISGIYNWTPEAVYAIIDCYSTRKHLFRNKNVRHLYLWVEVEEDIAAQGFSFPAESIEQKWRELLEMYRENLNSEDSDKPMFFNELHEVLQGEIDLFHSEPPPPIEKLEDYGSNNSESTLWPGVATNVFLECYRRRLTLFRSKSMRKMILYQEIAEEMGAHGYEYTMEQVKRRWRTLLAVYAKYKNGLLKNEFIYADQMRELVDDDTPIDISVSEPVGNIGEGDILSQIGGYILQDTALIQGVPNCSRAPNGKKQRLTKNQLVDYFKECINQQIAKEEESFEQLRTIHEEKITMMNAFLKSLDSLT